MHILLTNDDGIAAPGLLALKQALDDVGQVVVFAPDHNWSAAGHTKTMHKPLRVSEVTMADGTMAYTTTGTPSDCVVLAVLGFVSHGLDLVVSGINLGANVGHDITYSGTVAAAMQGVVSDIPAIAVSLDTYDGRAADFGPAARFAARLANQVLQHGLPPNTLLNVNVPAVPADNVLGIRITRLGRRVYRDVLVEREDPKGRPYYWIGGEPPGGVAEDGTDIGALANHCISVTPLQMDMTAYGLLDELREWGLESRE